MDFELPEELAEVQKLARDFSEKEIAPNAAKDDREHIFRKDLVVKMGELGFYGCLIPEEFGGNGLGFLAHALISEEIARVHSAIRVYLNMQAGPAVTLFDEIGTATVYFEDGEMFGGHYIEVDLKNGTPTSADIVG